MGSSTHAVALVLFVLGTIAGISYGAVTAEDFMEMYLRELKQTTPDSKFDDNAYMGETIMSPIHRMSRSVHKLQAQDVAFVSAVTDIAVAEQGEANNPTMNANNAGVGADVGPDGFFSARGAAAEASRITRPVASEVAEVGRKAARALRPGYIQSYGRRRR